VKSDVSCPISRVLRTLIALSIEAHGDVKNHIEREVVVASGRLLDSVHALGTHILAKTHQKSHSALNHRHLESSQSHAQTTLDTTTPQLTLPNTVAIMSAVQSVQCFGKKKNATAVAHCKQGKGLIRVNGKPLSLVEPQILRFKVYEPVLILGLDKFGMCALHPEEKRRGNWGIG